MRDYHAKLNAILDDVYEEAELLGYTMKQLAKKAKLCLVTVVRIQNRVTKFPRFRSVYNLSKAVGFDINLVKLVRDQRRKIA